MNIKKIMIEASLAALILGAAAVPAFAERPAYGEQPGYDNASECGSGHGAFAYFNGDNNLGTKSLGPGTPTYHGGARGQENFGVHGGATGYNNSHLCGNPQ